MIGWVRCVSVERDDEVAQSRPAAASLNFLNELALRLSVTGATLISFRTNSRMDGIYIFIEYTMSNMI